MENELGFISNSLSSFGKFNAILFFKSDSRDFQIIYSDLVDTFRSTEIKKSFFDLDSQKMRVMDSIDPFNARNCIVQVIFKDESEEIILEYFNSQFIIENLFHSENLKTSKGYERLKKYLTTKEDATLILGYELSIAIDSFDESLQNIIDDVSCHPVAVIKIHSGRLERKEYVSDPSEISKKKILMILQYFKKLEQH